MRVSFVIILLFFTLNILYANGPSEANKELKEKENESTKRIIDFFSKEFTEREPRILIGYNYFPDFPLSFEGVLLRNGFGVYIGLGCDPRGFNDDLNRNIGDTLGIINLYLGITYPFYFDWLWITGGFEMCATDTAISSNKYDSWTYFETKEELTFNPSIGAYISLRRIYITTKYRYCFYENGNHSFMLGIGISLGITHFF